MLQLLLGNIGRPGGGIVALRGHATIQGSTDIPTLYHSIHGYMPAPTVLKPHDTLEEYLKAETLPTSYWANMPKFFVSYLKSMYGDAATNENDFGFGWHPRISGDHSHMPMMVAMNEGRVRGMFAMGQNPAVGGQNARYQRMALGKLDWLVVKDNFETETAAFWYKAPEVVDGSSPHRGHPDRGLLLPLGPGRGDGRHLHQHAAPDQVPRQGGRPARRRPLRHLVHLPPRQAAEEALRRAAPSRATRASSTWPGTTSPTRKRSRPGGSRTSRAR